MDKRKLESPGSAPSALTAQLLAFGQKQVNRSADLRVNDAICEVCELVSCMLPRNIELELDLDPKAATIDFEPWQFCRVVIDLVVTACGAMPAGGTLRIRTGGTSLDERGASRVGLLAGSYTLISIADTATGILREEQDLVIEPLFATRPSRVGTGLGLSTVHGTVASYGGAISTQSQPGRGTTFRLHLPSQMAAPGPRALHSSVSPLAGERTLLVVDDDVFWRDLVREVLEEQGLHVLTAEGPRAGLDLVERRGGRIHLLVTDVVMPQMSGFALAKLLKGKTDDVLFMSGYADLVLAQQRRPALESEFIRKPFGHHELIAKVRAMLAATSEAQAASSS